MYKQSIILLILTALIAGCGAGGQSEQETVRPFSCAALSLAASSAQPMDSVAVRGLPDAYDGLLYAEVRLPSDTATGYAFTGRTADGAIRLQVPLHPSGSIKGGPVELRFTDGAMHCPAQRFNIEPLPPAPGTFRRVVDQVQDFVRAQAAVFGATPEGLRTTTPDTLFPPLIPLWVAQTVLDHPENPNSLRQVLMDNASVLEGDSADLQLTDAVLARSDVLEILPALVQRTDSLRLKLPAAPSELRDIDFAYAERPRSRRASPFMFAAYGGPAPVGAAPTTQPDVSEMTVERLDWAMSLAMSSDIATSGRAKDIFSAFKASLALGAGLASAAGVAPLAAGYTDVAAIAFAYEQAALAAANLLPRRFTHLDFNLHKPVFMEDDAEPGRWSEAQVTAESKGWQLDQMILQTLLQISGLKGSGGITKKTKWIEAMPRGHMRKLAYNLRQFLISDLLGKLIGGTAGKDGPLKIGPQSFTADISAPQWHDVKYGGRAVQVVLGSEGKRYEPIRVGQSTITVSTPPMKFGFQLIRREKTIDVRPIRVTVRPVKVTVPPGDTVTFRAAVENAKDRTLSWETQPPGHRLIAADPERLTARLVTKRDPALFPIRIRATSQADRTHLLQVKPRVAEARVHTPRIEISPAVICLRPGQRKQFEADVPDVNVGGVVLPGGASQLDWSASVGRIDARGQYRAPDQAGEVTITARSRTHPDLKGEAVIRVGGCTCWMTGSIGRPLQRLVGGVAHLEPGGGLLPPGVRVTGDILSLTNDVGFGRGTGGEPILSVRIEVPGLTEGGAGPLDVRHAWAESAGEFTAMIDPSAPTTGRGAVTVTDRSDAAIEGVFTGWLKVFGENGEVLGNREAYLTPVRLRFRAVTGSRADPGSDWMRCLMDDAGVGGRP